MGETELQAKQYEIDRLRAENDRLKSENQELRIRNEQLTNLIARKGADLLPEVQAKRAQLGKLK